MGGYGLLALICLIIGIFFETAYICTLVAGRRGYHSSGVPLMAGIFFTAALAAFPPTRSFWYLGIFLDLSTYMVIYVIITDVILGAVKGKKGYLFRISVLADNKESGEYCGEHGLSLYIEYGSRKILLDAGRSSLFYENAEKMGIDLTRVDDAVLSHSHYDHADGFEKFLEINKKARLYMRKEAGEIYYSQHDDGMKYIGPKKGMLEKYKNRIVYVTDDVTTLGSWSVILLPHTTDGLAEIGDKAKLYKMMDGRLQPDDFKHEQTLVLETEKGLVIINSCSHAGAANIIKEVMKYYDGYTVKRKVYAYIGGFHLFKSSDEDIIEFAETLKEVDCRRIITGHCTGDHAYEMLKAELGDRVEQMRSGMVIEL
ncbi:7,8-dihydropterin-6-yl-methyl-4-(beta-D-ribofuranosyl)aminobenzene 5'-phosphate synthase [Eubacterium ruminantium]|nr:7,8-dihydropterin-6-yl-methyl-4-(beta-D-ribofuranosyl)aminobenzene 5'-phosphate synthase [Eubacterium ruminantium]